MGMRRGGAGWFRRLGSPRDGDGDEVDRKESRRCKPSWRRRLGAVFSASAWRWKRSDVRFTLLDRVVFHLMYILEAVVLVAMFCFYFCRFGCRI